MMAMQALEAQDTTVRRRILVRRLGGAMEASEITLPVGARPLACYPGEGITGGVVLLIEVPADGMPEVEQAAVKAEETLEALAPNP